MSTNIVVDSKFIAGLKTDVALDFPENACFDVDNMVFDIIGNVERRKGMDFELNNTTNTVDRTNKAISTFIWTNAGGDGNTKVLVLQIGGTLYFYQFTNATIAAPLSTTKLASTITLSTFSPPSGTSPNAVECQFTSGNGYLFVFHPYLEPFYCTFAAGTITGMQIAVRVRDVIGIPETNVDDNYRPLTLSNEHTYNLYNQGWTNSPAWSATSSSTVTYATGSRTFTVASGLSITAGDSAVASAVIGSSPGGGGGGSTMNGLVTSYGGTTLVINVTSLSNPAFSGATASSWTITKLNAGLITTWHTATGNYPSNADVWWYFKNSSGVFDPATTYGNVTLASSPAPKGAFILNAFDQNRGSVSGVASLTTVTTTVRPRTGTWFQGRVWYAGVDASFAATGDAAYTTWTENIYFSQVVEKAEQFGKCYDVNDPTSETLFDLLPTDGGVITIQGSGSIFKLFPIQNGMLVFAANGIWFITGSQGIGFTANDYTITKISSIQSISSTSFVDVVGYPVFWNEEGIYKVTPGERGGLSVDSLTVSNIGDYYEAIPLSAKKYARGAYNPIDYRIQWCFKSAEETDVTSRYEFNKILNFNTVTSAFFPWSFTGTPKIHDVLFVQSPGGSTAPTAIFKYLTSYADTGSFKFTFSEQFDLDYIDWDTYTTSVDYTSYFTTGYKLPGKAFTRVQSPYIVIYGIAGIDARAQVQSRWDFAIDADAGKWSPEEFVQFGTDTDYRYSAKRIRTRGAGRVLQLRFSSLTGKPMSLVGWSTMLTVNEAA